MGKLGHLPAVHRLPLPRGLSSLHREDEDGVLHIWVPDDLTAQERADEVQRVMLLVSRGHRRGLVAIPALLATSAVRTARAHPTQAIGAIAGSTAIAVVATVVAPAIFHWRSHDPPPPRQGRPPATASPRTSSDRVPVEVTPVHGPHPRGKSGATAGPSVVPVSGHSASPAGPAKTPVVVGTPRVGTPQVGTPKVGRVPLPTDVPKLPPVAVVPVRFTLPAAALRVGVAAGPVGLDAEVSSRPGDAGLLPTVAATVRVGPR
ncbi:MAG: hypothetical protein JWO67_2046 [Streptosporangiaceae bacterium]|nr:hypothetical protein [Streptosporangiaceae bacterium]